MPFSKTADALTAQLAIDKIVDPLVDTAKTRSVVDRLTSAAKQIAGPDADDNQKFAAVRRVIYEAGPWNDNRPFSYDHNDPQGAQIQHKLLSTYIKTRLGNCVSMPTLFLIIAERLRLNVHLSEAPQHMFIQYVAPNGHIVNVEPTSGAHFLHTSWYRQNLPMSDKALASGIYMRPLSKEEGIALMATTALEDMMNKHRYADAIAVADVILRHNPRDAYVIVKRGTAFGEMLKAEFQDKYPSPEAIPVNLRSRMNKLADENAKGFRHAEALGWEPDK